MKLCMYVGYHDTNNVSNFGGDPIKFKKTFYSIICVCPKTYCSVHDEWLIMRLCMYVGYYDANNVSNFGGDPVTQLNLKTFYSIIYTVLCRCSIAAAVATRPRA